MSVIIEITSAKRFESIKLRFLLIILFNTFLATGYSQTNSKQPESLFQQINPNLFILLALVLTAIALILVLRKNKQYRIAEKYSYGDSEKLLKTIIELLPELVWLKDKDGIYITCNRKFEEFFGATEAQIRGKTDYNFVNKELADLFRENDKRAMEAKAPVINEEEVKYAIDGHIELLETIKRPIYDDEGKIFGILGVARDITARKKLEREQYESEQMLRSILDTIPVRVFWKDLDSTYLGSNRLFANDAGLSEHETVENKTDFDFGFEEAEQYRADDARVMKTGETKINFEESQSTEDGGLIWLNTSKIPLRDKDGKVNGVLGTYEDITARKLNEEKLLASNQKLKALAIELRGKNTELKCALEEVSRSKELEETIKQLKDAQIRLVQSEKLATVGLLTAGIAHEINNPLNFIHGGVKAIESYYKEFQPDHASEIEPLIEIVETGVNRSVEIINSLNRFNRTSDKNEEACDLNVILDDCLVMLENKLKYTVKVVKEFTDDAIVIKGNEGKIHQALINILTNSIHAIEESGKIILKTFVTNGIATIEITDTGKGISEENLQKISEPFFTTKPPGEGTGLGLSIVHNIIAEHNGHVHYDSILGEGTTVTVTFPIGS